MMAHRHRATCYGLLPPTGPDGRRGMVLICPLIGWAPTDDRYDWPLARERYVRIPTVLQEVAVRAFLVVSTIFALPVAIYQDWRSR